jgi:hypothetical protein
MNAKSPVCLWSILIGSRKVAGILHPLTLPSCCYCVAMLGDDTYSQFVGHKDHIATGGIGADVMVFLFARAPTQDSAVPTPKSEEAAVNRLSGAQVSSVATDQ